MNLAMKIPVLLLRLIALAATVAAVIVMVKAKETTHVLNMTFEAEFSHSPSSKYFVGVNAIAAGYTLIVIFLPSRHLFGNMLLVLDLVIILLMDSSLAACLAIAQVGKNGNSHAGWLPICVQVPKFCEHVKGAIISGIVASVIYFLLFLYSLHNVLKLHSKKPDNA